MGKYEKGKIVTGNVTGVEKYGIFVGLDDLYSGLVHISEVSTGFVKDIYDYVAVGETIRVRVVESNEENCQVKLSIKDIDYRISQRTRQKIEETASGFAPLRDNLTKWISDKYTELKKNEKS